MKVTGFQDMTQVYHTAPNQAEQRFFTRKLMYWHQHHNDRSLPWKEEKDPYRIWLSEVILQQTRAQQGIPYYLKFIEAFPDVGAMAAAEDQVVFRLWQGLGYYNRCRNMLATARYIVENCNGKFPDSYNGLLELKGIGPYTAAAVSSFAFGLPHAVVDGNVYRVLARYFGIETSSDSTEGKKQFAVLAASLLEKSDSGAYNQAIMDLGATVCTPQAARCSVCPLHEHCFAFRHEAVDLFPVRTKKQTVKKRYFHYLLLQTERHIWIRRRQEKDIWQDLHEPYLIEMPYALDTDGIRDTDAFRQLHPANAVLPVYEGLLTQRLTHQLIEARFFVVQLQHKNDVITPDDGTWVAYPALKKMAFPKTLVSFLTKKLYF